MADERNPKLIAFPTMTLDALLAATEAPTEPPKERGGTAYLQPDGPHVWVLRIGERDVSFPPGRFTALELHDDRVVRIRCHPQLDYVGPAAASALVMDVRKRLEEAGFVEAEALGEQKVKERLTADGGVRACRFRAGEWMGEVRAERVIVAETPGGKLLQLEEDACLVVVVLWDLRLAAAMIG